MASPSLQSKSSLTQFPQPATRQQKGTKPSSIASPEEAAPAAPATRQQLGPVSSQPPSSLAPKVSSAQPSQGADTPQVSPQVFPDRHPTAAPPEKREIITEIREMHQAQMKLMGRSVLADQEVDRLRSDPNAKLILKVVDLKKLAIESGIHFLI